MSGPVLFVSDRFPSLAGAGAESVLSALCTITAGSGTTVDFLIIESPLIRINFERLPTDYGRNLAFLRAVRQPGNQLAAVRLPDGEAYGLDLMQYKKIFVFGDENIIFFDRLSGQKIAWPDDPPHLVSDFKAGCSLLPLRSRLLSRFRGIKERWQQHLLHRALRSYELIVHHAHHHAEEFRRTSSQTVVYAPPLIPSMSAQKPSPDHSPLIPRRGFIHIGHLGGAASLASIETLLSPSLCEHLKTSKDSLVLIGKADIPEVIKSSLETAGYKLMGFVDDLESIMTTCRAVIVPGNYTVGARTRILHSLSLGTPVVAHRSCLAGIPELQSCIAVELFDSAEELVRALDNLENIGEAASLQHSMAALEFMAEFAPRVEQKWRCLFD